MYICCSKTDGNVQNIVKCAVFIFCLSVSEPFKGDYLEINKNPKYQKLYTAVDEKVLLADLVNKINRANGKVREITVGCIRCKV